MKGSLPFVTVTMLSWSLILQKNIEKMGLMQLQLLLHLHVVSMSKKTLPWGRNLKPCLRPTSYSSWNRHSFTIQGQKRDNLRFASVAAGILSNRAILIVNRTILTTMVPNWKFSFQWLLCVRVCFASIIMFRVEWLSSGGQEMHYKFVSNIIGITWFMYISWSVWYPCLSGEAVGEMMLRGEDNWRKKRKTTMGSWDGQDLFFFWSKVCLY